MELEGAHVLVTGASRGIGAELSRLFAAAGARVTGVARSEDRLAEVVAGIEANGGSAAFLAADLVTPEGRGDLIARAEETGGPVDVLVNNAGVDAIGDFAALSAEDLERITTLNLLVPLELTRQALPGMIARDRGNVCNISSASGVGVMPGIVAYGTTKSGLTHFTAGLRAELKGTGVRTTVVEVGFVETAMREEILAYPPARRAYDRLQRLGSMPDTPIGTLCQATVDAVAAGRRHVRFPARMRPMMALAEAPRRLTELSYAGVRSRP